MPLSGYALKRQNNSGLTSAPKKPKPSTPNSPIDERCVNFVRVLAADMVQQANSGHPGAAMGCAPIAHVLWSKIMNYDPADPVRGPSLEYVGPLSLASLRRFGGAPRR